MSSDNDIFDLFEKFKNTKCRNARRSATGRLKNIRKKIHESQIEISNLESAESNSEVQANLIQHYRDLRSLLDQHSRTAQIKGMVRIAENFEIFTKAFFLAHQKANYKTEDSNE